ncbi:MAG TPA: carbamoyl phosphate synthase small subunit [Syntrophomonadaceae bacterium]|nr:carbamoyl phosphate synthase small subunit [Syntrophomonadaceae bacterium]
MTFRSGYLVLENGAVFRGKLRGAAPAVGEVVFNTSMVGYDQIISDPSYTGQIVVLTYPLVGNYGFNRAMMESDRCWLRGLVIKELNNGANHYQQEQLFHEYLAENNLPCLWDIDTRALTRMIRTHGTMGGVITDNIDNFSWLVQQAAEYKPPAEGYVRQATCREITCLGQGELRVVVVDFGVKKAITKSLLNRGCQVVQVPATTNAEIIKGLEPDGIVLSNGPGNPEDCDYALPVIRQLMGYKPMLGICLGHQLIALAWGGKTSKMVFGHRGANQPVKDLCTGRVYITSQNHGYMVNEESLANLPVEVTFRNLNDGTVEGLRHKVLPIMSVQFHPEAAPGPLDSGFLMDEFIQMVKDYKYKERAELQSHAG